MSSRTLGIIKRVGVVVGALVYAVLATRTAAYIVISSSTSSQLARERANTTSWWNIADASIIDWLTFTGAAALATVVLLIVGTLAWWGIEAVWHWIVAPRPSEIAADARKKDEMAAAEAEKARKRNLAPNGEPISVPDEKSASGGFEQPPVDQGSSPTSGPTPAFRRGIFLED